MANIALNKPSGGQLILSPEDGTSTETLSITPTGFPKQSGEIVQEVYRMAHGSTSLSAANTWTTPSADYYCDITPKFSDSTLIVEYQVPFNPTGAANILMTMQPTWYNVTQGTSWTQVMDSQSSVADGSRYQQSASWFRSNNGYDNNDMQTHNFIGIASPNSTDTFRFSFQFRQEATQTVYFAVSQGNNSTWGWTAPIIIRITEVAA